VSPRAALGALALAAWLSGCGASGPGIVVVPPPGERAHHDDAAHASRPPLPPPTGRPPSHDEAEAIHPLLFAAERVRGLRSRTDVPIRIEDASEIVAFVQSRLDPHEVEHARVFYVAIGLLPHDLDVRAAVLRLMGEQVVGFYDPDSGTLVLRDDVARELRALRSAGRGVESAESAMVLVHELVHALQDQQLGLGDRYYDERTSDAGNAFASLVEGDATLAMVGWLAERQGGRLSQLTQDPTTLRALIDGGAVQTGGPEMAAAPPILRAPLLSRYLDGLVFCATIHGRGGFRALDGAHRDPPTTSEQVLHPERYLAHEEGEPITLPELPALAAAGFSPHDEDTLGELELSVWLAIGTSVDRDRAAAAGWGGDRLRVYADASGATCAVWWTTWDDEAEAGEAEAAARAVATHLPNVRLHRTGRALSILIDVPDAAASESETAFDAWAVTLPPRWPS
jgi:hypothetical protein